MRKGEEPKGRDHTTMLLKSTKNYQEIMSILSFGANKQTTGNKNRNTKAASLVHFDSRSHEIEFGNSMSVYVTLHSVKVRVILIFIRVHYSRSNLFFFCFFLFFLVFSVRYQPH